MNTPQNIPNIGWPDAGDDIPEGMSPVIGHWIIAAGQWMPDEIRNSDEWNALLLRAERCGSDREAERRAILIDWIWDPVLKNLQSVADDHGYGTKWRRMCAERTGARAGCAGAGEPTGRAACEAAWVGMAADSADDAARLHTVIARLPVRDAADAAYAASWSKYVAAAAAHAATAAGIAARSTKKAAWATMDPVAVLRRMIECRSDAVNVKSVWYGERFAQLYRSICSGKCGAWFS